MTLILGLDPGSRRTGFGLVHVTGNTLEYVSSGTIHINEKAEWPERLNEVFDSVREIIAKHHPQEVAIEQVFMGKSAGSALKLGQARGAAIVAATHENLPVFEYEARKIKQAVVGSGGAEKKQVQQMVKMLLNLPAIPKEDAADALAVAICHAHTQKLLIQLAKGKGFSKSRLR
jgi:crossover junction endodeoxyribonuclease RuvC